MHESEHFCAYLLAKSRSLWTTFGMLLQHVDWGGGGRGAGGELTLLLFRSTNTNGRELPLVDF